MNTLLDSGVEVDGVVALNDMLASGVMHAIQMRGLRIPDDISVVGFDNSDDSQYLSPALTSIAPGLEAVARLSVKVLKERIDGRDPNVDKPGRRSSARSRRRWSCANPPNSPPIPSFSKRSSACGKFPGVPGYFPSGPRCRTHRLALPQVPPPGMGARP